MINLSKISVDFLNIILHKLYDSFLFSFYYGNVHFKLFHKTIVRLHRCSQLDQNPACISGEFQHLLERLPVEIILESFHPDYLV